MVGSERDCWAVLGIAATGDERAIRRAYATLLKQIRPDERPAEFIELRDAFEMARRRAQWLQQAADDEYDEDDAEDADWFLTAIASS